MGVFTEELFFASPSSLCVCMFQVAMQRAKVCVRLVSLSGKNHLRLLKVKDMQPEIADHEAAYRDNTGEVCVCVRVRVC